MKMQEVQCKDIGAFLQHCHWEVHGGTENLTPAHDLAAEADAQAILNSGGRKPKNPVTLCKSAVVKNDKATAKSTGARRTRTTQFIKRINS